MKSIVKRITVIILITVIAVVFMPVFNGSQAFAAVSLDPCGNNLNSQWDNGTVKVLIKSTGYSDHTAYAMTDFSSFDETPWSSYKDSITAVDLYFGIYSIGKNAFNGCTNLKTVYLPYTVQQVNENAFKGCTNLKTVYFGGTQAQWNSAKNSFSTGNEALLNAPTVVILNKGSVDIDLSKGPVTYSGAKLTAIMNTLDYLSSIYYINKIDGKEGYYDLDDDGTADFFITAKDSTHKEFKMTSECSAVGYRDFSVRTNDDPLYFRSSIYNDHKTFYDDFGIKVKSGNIGSHTVDMSKGKITITDNKVSLAISACLRNCFITDQSINVTEDSDDQNLGYFDIDKDGTTDFKATFTDEEQIVFEPLIKSKANKSCTMSTNACDKADEDEFTEHYYSKLIFKFPTISIANAKVGSIAVKDYTGNAWKPSPSVTYNGTTLKKGTDYTLSYSNNTKIGTATVTVTGQGKYSGTLKKNFYIKGNLSKAATKVSVQSIAKKTYSGSAQTPAPWVKAVLPGGTVGKLTNGTSYTLSYKNNVNVGKASLIITGKNKYKGTKTVYFTIGPKGTTIKSITPVSKGFKVVWNKQTVQTSGYDIIYSSKSDFSTYAIKTVAGNGNYIKSVTGLNANRKYYVKVRTYKMVDGVKYLSAWSAVSTVTTKA